MHCLLSLSATIQWLKQPIIFCGDIAIAIKIADKIPNSDTYELIANVQTFHTLKPNSHN